jgi:aryl-alcohol dehydrogenase-like predicted oxidoreductase
LPGTALQVPYATIGCMMFGGRADAAESGRIVDAALDHGINYFDTANGYANGESERILGRALKGRRDKAIVATKVGYGKDDAGNEEGLSRKAILRAIDQSLERLGMEYVDIYYLHRPDYETPIEDTLETMQEVIRAGKARHFAISNFGGWQSYEILGMCRANGWQLPVMTQMIYNVLLRQIEFEYVRFCKRQHLHLTVYNPLAGGLLTGKYASLSDEKSGGRFIDNPMYRNRYWSERYLTGALRLKQIADDLGMSLTHLAINWIAQQDKVDSILLGPSNLDHFLDCLAAGDREISEEGMNRISEFLREFEGTDASYAR